jgi:arylsulfatase A-like enzyme
VNLLPFVTGGAHVPHEALYWRFGERRAIRKGSWKVVWDAAGPELYDLAADLSEKNNLAATNPAKLKELTADWEAWNRTLAEPRWRNGRQDRQKKKKKGRRAA